METKIIGGVNGNKNLKGGEIELEGICSELKYSNGGFILPASYSGMLMLPSGEEVEFKSRWHIMYGRIEFLSEWRNSWVLKGVNEIGKPVKIRGVLKEKKGNYFLKVNDVSYGGNLEDLTVDGTRIGHIIEDIDEMIADFTPYLNVP